MKECKCGRIPSCYGGKMFSMHEELEKIKPCSEETAQGVIEALRNASELSEASNRLAEHIFEDILKSIKSNDMEEKKTKMMTKAEAFEWLKGKRVVCDNFNSVAIQRKFFEVGIMWRGGSTEASEDRGSFLFVDLNGCLTHCNSRAWFDAHEYEEISAEDILSIEILEDKNKEFVDCSKPCDEIKAVQELLRNSKHLKDKILVITKDNAAIL